MIHSSETSRRRLLLLVIALTALYCAPLIPQGIDFADDGIHLVHQQLLAKTGWAPSTNRDIGIWLSNLVGGIWLKLAGGGLFGARVGWVVLMVWNAGLVFLMVSRLFSPGRTAIAVLLTVPIVTSQCRMLIDYDQVPNAFLVIALAFHLAAAPSSGRRSQILFGLSGLAIGFAALARLLTIAAILIPWIAVGFSRFWGEKEEHQHRLRGAALSAAGTLSAFVLTFLFLLVTGKVPTFLALLSMRDLPTGHSLSGLLPAYFSHGVIVLSISAGIAAVLGAWRNRWTIASVAVFAAACVMPVRRLRQVILRWPPEKVTDLYIHLVIAVCVGALIHFFLNVSSWSGDAGKRARIELLLLATVAAYFVCIGSNTVFRKMTYGLWFALPVAFLLIRETAALREGRTRRAWAIPILAAILGIVVRFFSPFHDAADRTRLTSEIHHPKLAGILTTKERAKSVNEMLEQLQPRVAPGDSLLAYGHLPLIHYLTETEFFLGSSWPMPLGRDQVVRRLDQAAAESRVPVVAVHAKNDSMARDWGDGRERTMRGVTSLHLINNWLESQGFVEVWSNDEFVILEPGASDVSR